MMRYDLKYNLDPQGKIRHPCQLHGLSLKTPEKCVLQIAAFAEDHALLEIATKICSSFLYIEVINCAQEVRGS